MKELSIEEKAKAYDEALKILHKYDGAHIMFTQDLKEEMFPELVESGDEKMIKFIKNQLFNIKKTITKDYELDAKLTKAIDWLEKQGEHKKFCDSIQVGDKVTRNQDGVLVNLSQLKRVAKPNETKQGEQKPIKEHNICDTCDEKASCIVPCPIKLVEQKPTDKNNNYDRQRKN